MDIILTKLIGNINEKYQSEYGNLINIDISGTFTKLQVGVSNNVTINDNIENKVKGFFLIRPYGFAEIAWRYKNIYIPLSSKEVKNRLFPQVIEINGIKYRITENNNKYKFNILFLFLAYFFY